MILAAQRRLYDRSPSHLREGTPGRHSTPTTGHMALKLTAQGV